MNAQPQYQPQDDAILTKAFLRAGGRLELNQKEMSRLLGCSEPTMSRLSHRHGSLEPASKEGEIALIFLRIYRSLDALFGGNEQHIRQWFTSHNEALQGIPREQIKTLHGLFTIANYLDAMRGKV